MTVTLIEFTAPKSHFFQCRMLREAVEICKNVLCVFQEG